MIATPGIRGRRLIPLTLLFAAIAVAAACGPDRSRQRSRSADADDPAEVDPALPTTVRPEFEVPADWETVSNPAGLYFHQPRGFTFGLDAARLHECNASTPRAEVPVLDRGFLEEWPLTMAMRRGDLNQIARTNGFTLDSTDVASHEGGGTTVKRGEGWLLLSGRSEVAAITFGAVRAPGGCYLVLAARGMEINPDTLGLVLGTLRFGAPPASPPDSTQP